MPTTNKRINLTVPQPVYERLESYKSKNGISSDAAACLQLIIRQLDSLEQADKMLDMVRKFSPEELQALSNIGVQEIIKYTQKDSE